MERETDFLVAKTVPSVYFLHLEQNASSPGFWFNLAQVTEIMERQNSLVVKFADGRSYTFTGDHAKTILEELEVIKRRYQ